VSLSALPVVDASEFLAKGEDASFVTALREACHDPGFCYLVGHGIERHVDAQLIEQAGEFFALPADARAAIAIGRSPHFRGYTVLGDERTLGRRDWRDQIDIGPEAPALALSEDDPPWLRLQGPNQWPAGLPQFRLAVSQWLRCIDSLAQAMMRAIALGLGQTAGVFDSAIQPTPYTRLKIIRYPAQTEGEDDGQGLGLHQDSGLLTLILQDEVGGLQVKTPAGLVDVSPMPGAYILNLGEMLQAASGGYLRATPHQVTSPPSGRQRISIAYFFNPRLDAVFTPLTLPPELAARARGGQNNDPSDPVFSTFGENTLKIRMRAHPDVSRAFYAGVELGKH
jgi:isopenicillin N synthase-like dioxygenase